MNLEDKNIRKALAEKYLSAETSVEEEIALAGYYSDHQPEEDEKAFAAMLTATVEGWLLSDEGADEYDRIATSKAIPLKMNIFRWAAGIVAAAVVALGIILPLLNEKETPLSPVVIAEGIGQIMEMEIYSGKVESISAVPQGSKALITLKLRDGSEYYYMMTYNESAGAMALVAVNNNPKQK